MQTIAGSYQAPLEREHLKGDLCVPSLEEVEGFFSSLLPGSAFSAGFSGEGNDLFDAEAAEVKGISETRLKEFALGRAAAHRAMERLGLSPSPVLKGGSGEPLWPEGVVGSISHCRGLAFCSVTFAEKYCSVGVDVENVDRMRPELVRKVMTPAERSEWEKLDESEALHRLALVFSAKEAFFKFQYPLTGAFVGFKDVALEHVAGRGFRMAPLRKGIPAARGACCLAGRRVFTVVW